MKASDLEQVQTYKFGHLDIQHKNLTSLEGCPEKIYGSLFCHNNRLTSLEGCPERIERDFYCVDNQLSSFEYFPKIIGANCILSNNKFTSFKDIDQHIEFIGNELYVDNMNITSGFSDLFGIDGLQRIWIDNKEVQKITGKYLPKKDIIEFQDEMIKSGYESYL